MSEPIVVSLIFSTVFTVCFMAYLLFARQTQLLKTDARFSHLDFLRRDLEQKIGEMNSKFASTQERWNELNHLVISTPAIPNQEASLSPERFLRQHGISQRDQSIAPRSVFVLTPFQQAFESDYATVKEICSTAGFSCKRGDEKHFEGDIFPHILREIVQAEIIIANITGRNPNVFYELGVAHSLGKQVILLCQRDSDVPFDMRSKFIVFYSTGDELRDGLSKALLKFFGQGNLQAMTGRKLTPKKKSKRTSSNPSG